MAERLVGWMVVVWAAQRVAAMVVARAVQLDFGLADRMDVLRVRKLAVHLGEN